MGQNIQGVEHIIAVGSGKGGVGKSSTAMNLAVALSCEGKKVGLLDADIYGPSVPRMMGISREDFPKAPEGDFIEPVVRHGIKCMSMGFLVEEDTPVIWRGPMVLSALRQMLFQVNWGPLDILVLDMPPGTGDIQLSMAQQVALDGAVIVSTPQDIALIDSFKGLNMFKKVNIPILGMIENMSSFHCPSCGHESHIFGHGGVRQAAEKLDIELLAEIPLDLDIRLNTDAGNPVVLAMADHPHAGIYRQLATRICEKLRRVQGTPVKIVIEEATGVQA